MRKYSLLLILALAACQPSGNNASTNEEIYQPPDHHTPELTAVFDAHGGYQIWSKMKSLSYDKGEESTITNLENRNIRIDAPNQTIGFDGTNVWVAPDTVDASRARFYHNLYFYFFAMPFVVGDPGAFYEQVAERELAGKVFTGIKVTYGENVGDAPDDSYILWFDPETKQMEWLMYTVTYRSGKPSENYNLIRYTGWTKFNELLLPTSLQWYTFEEDTVGEARGSAAIFEAIEISEAYPDSGLFRMPENAQIAPR